MKLPNILLIGVTSWKVADNESLTMLGFHYGISRSELLCEA
ncbi:hypothetical protein [Shewanella sairae]|nr:hypothetical protein [Shewanella sairae]